MFAVRFFAFSFLHQEIAERLALSLSKGARQSPGITSPLSRFARHSPFKGGAPPGDHGCDEGADVISQS